MGVRGGNGIRMVDWGAQMIRTCDGTDPFLVGKPTVFTGSSSSSDPKAKPLATSYAPCACGAVFDDVERLVIWPHERIRPKPSYEELVALARAVGVLDEGSF
jgi:hypothetical protein